MARRVEEFNLRYTADNKDFVRGTDQVIESSKKAEKQFTSLKAASKDAFSGFNLRDVAVTGVGIGFIKKTTDAYGALVNVQQTANQVFGDSVNLVNQWAEDSVEAVGLSERAAIEAATFIAGLGKQVGFADDQLVDFSTDLIQLSADLAAAFNTDVADAVQAIQSGFSGSSIEPLRKYNIVINDTAIKQEYMALTGDKVVGVLNQEQRALGFLSLLYKRSADYVGQWERESDQLLGTQQRLRAQFENTAATLGETYAPAVLTALDSTLQLMNLFAEFDAKAGGLLGAAAGFAAITVALTPLRRGISNLERNLNNSTAAFSNMGATIAGKLNPALFAMTGALTAYSLFASNIAKQQRQVSEAFEDFIEVAQGGPEAMEAWNNALEQMAEAEAFDMSFLDIVNEGAKAMVSTLWTGVDAWKAFQDAETLTIEEAQEGFIQLAKDNLQLAAGIREAAEAGGDPVADKLTDAGLSLDYMDYVLASVAANQENFNSLIEDGQKHIDILTGNVKEMGNAVDEAERKAQKKLLADYFKEVDEKARKAAETVLEFNDYFSDLEKVRLDAQTEAFETIFARNARPREVATNIRDIYTGLQDIIDLEGDLGDAIGALFDPGDERGEDFLGALDQIASAVEAELAAALESGGVDKFRTMGERYRLAVREGLLEAGAGEKTVEEILETMGLDEEGIEANIKIILDAEATAEAIALLDLMRQEGLLGEGAEAVERFIKLNAIIEQDPEKGLDAIQAIALQQGVDVPLTLLGEFDAVAAQQTLEDAGLTLPVGIVVGPPAPGSVDAQPDALLRMLGISEVPIPVVPEPLPPPTAEEIWGDYKMPVEVEPRVPRRPPIGAVDEMEKLLEHWPGMPLEMPSIMHVEDVGTDQAASDIDHAARDRTAQIYVEYVPVNTYPDSPWWGPRSAGSPRSGRGAPAAATAMAPTSVAFSDGPTVRVPVGGGDTNITYINNPPGTPAATYDQSTLYRRRNGDRTQV